MTNDELQAIKARAEAATAGPWVADVQLERMDDEPRVYGINTAYDDPDGDPEYPRKIRLVETDAGYYPPNCADAEFIAHARTDVPKLVEEVARLNELLVIALRPEKCSCGREMNVFPTCPICDNDE